MSVAFRVLNSRTYVKYLTRDITPHNLFDSKPRFRRTFAPILRVFFSRAVLAGFLLELLLILEYGNDILM
jgi:hypothetical protein